MSEEIVTAPVPQETPEEPSAAVSEPPVLEQPPTPEPKKRGRPQGTKDVVKRTRKPAVKLRVEPVVREPAPTSQAPAAEPPVVPPALQREPTSAYEPQSPKTLFRRYHESISQERRQKKDEHAQQYVSNWARWPV
jgi:hypothetical protein